MKYIADLLKESFPTSSPISEQIQKFLNGKGFDLENEQLNENLQISLSSTAMIDDPVPTTSDFSSVKEEADYDFQKTDKDTHSSMVFPDRIDKNIPALLTISVIKDPTHESPKVAEDSHPSSCSQEKVEDDGKPVPTPTTISGKMQKDLNEEVFSPHHKMLMENTQLCVISSGRINNIVSPDLLFDEESVNLDIQKNYETHHPCTILQDNIEDNVPAVTAISLSNEENICEYQKIVEDSHPSLFSTYRVEDGIHDVQEILNEEKLDQKILDENESFMDSYVGKEGLPDTPEILLKEEEPDGGYQRIDDENDFSMRSCDRIESIPNTPQILLLNEEEPDGEHQMIIDENDFSKNSESTMENERLPVLSVVEQESGETNCQSDPTILEPYTLAAAAKNVSSFCPLSYAVNLT